MTLRFAVVGLSCLLALSASAQGPAQPAAPVAPAQPAAPEAPAQEPGSVMPPLTPAADAAAAADEPSFAERLTSRVTSPAFLSRIQIHGFVSEGGFISTDNEYIGESSRGSLKFFEAGVNFSIELTDGLRAGLQFVSRSVGDLSEEVPRLDWAVIDYRYQPWVGLRAGLIKVPLGLYNEYIDIDSARTAILLPQSVYPLRNREALISHTGFGLYGEIPIDVLGALEYQAWFGTLTIPRSALELIGAELESVDTRYVTGGQLFWRPPLEGVRVGASYLRASIDFNLRVAADSVDELVASGLVPEDYQGALVISQDPTSIWVVSAEYIAGDWLFAAEYSRWLKHQPSSLPQVVPTLDEDAERFYALLTYRFSPYLELGTYFSVTHADVDDRRGRGPQFANNFSAFQRDLAATLRLDINQYWLWKIEGHFNDGVADLFLGENPNPTRFWGLFLFRTTVTF